jgi:hypothetical protein
MRNGREIENAGSLGRTAIVGIKGGIALLREDKL